MRRRLAVAGFAVASCLAASCGGFVDPSDNTTETFVLTVLAKGFTGQSFQVSRNGEYFVTLNSLTPPLPSNIPTHVQLTAQTDGTCLPNIQKVSENFGSLAGKQVLYGVFSQPGTYCLWVLDDQATFATDEVVSLTISHP